MPILKDLAQVVRVYEHRNTSLILVLLCRQLGQVRVLAKGARRIPKKGFEGGFDFLVRGEVVFYSRPDGQLWIFKEWDERARPGPFGTSTDQLHAASFLCELTEAMTRETAGSSHPEPEASVHASHQEPASDDSEQARLYDLLAQTADQLKPDGNPSALLLCFALRLLEITGHLPDLTRCSACERPLETAGIRQPALLSPKGLECSSCQAARASERDQVDSFFSMEGTTRNVVRVSPETLGALTYIKRTGKSVRMTPQAAAGAARTLTVLVHAALEHDLHTLSAITRMIQQSATDSIRP